MRLAQDMLEGKGRTSLVAAVALNAGAALYVSEFAETVEAGVAKARAALSDGSVACKISQVREATHA